MPISLDPAVQADLDEGAFHAVELVAFVLDSGTYRYWKGPRDLSWGGFTWKPSRYLDTGSTNEALGDSIASRTIKFSDVPTADMADAAAAIEDEDYLNRTVTVSLLAIDPQTLEPVGLLQTQVYEIHQAIHHIGEMDDNGDRAASLEIELEAPGRAERDSTQIKRSTADQQFDNDATDTGLDYVATVRTIQMEWGAAV